MSAVVAALVLSTNEMQKLQVETTTKQLNHRQPNASILHPSTLLLPILVHALFPVKRGGELHISLFVCNRVCTVNSYNDS